MDISSLVTQDSAEEGKWFEVEIYGKKQGFDLCILGNDSDTVKKYQRKQMKELSNSKDRKGNIKEEAFDQLFDSADVETAIKVVGVRVHDKKDEKLTIGDRVITDKQDDILYLLDRIPAVKDFVNSIAKDRESFLADGKKN